MGINEQPTANDNLQSAHEHHSGDLLVDEHPPDVHHTCLVRDFHNSSLLVDIDHSRFVHSVDHSSLFDHLVESYAQVKANSCQWNHTYVNGTSNNLYVFISTGGYAAPDTALNQSSSHIPHDSGHLM
ncbi:hypothetical protein M3Y99_00645000 [Aphelenchoides fujianensis]|nr:hypothetical protein M3Y99_00645000 [Aphelenchoides fujianensis]